MELTCFKVEIEHNIAHVILNRPDKRNAMNADFWRELPAIIHDIDDQSRARVIVISSTGPHFSAGLDLSMFGQADAESGPELNKNQRAVASYHHILHMQKTFNCLEACRLPVIAAVQGGAIGGGVDLSTACDIRYATKDAFFYHSRNQHWAYRRCGYVSSTGKVVTRRGRAGDGLYRAGHAGIRGATSGVG